MQEHYRMIDTDVSTKLTYETNVTRLYFRDVENKEVANMWQSRFQYCNLPVVNLVTCALWTPRKRPSTTRSYYRQSFLIQNIHTFAVDMLTTLGSGKQKNRVAIIRAHVNVATV